MNKLDARSLLGSIDLNLLLMNYASRAILTVELAALRSGESEVCKYLEGTLTRKIITRQILAAHFQNTEVTASDLVNYVGQSRQGITNQLSEMISMDLLFSEPGKDKRRKVLKPTSEMLNYWDTYCKTWFDIRETKEACVVLASFRCLGQD